MPLARYRLIDTKTTPYYHCVSRCVRRAFLCGHDNLSNKNFDHRKQWILDRIQLLSTVFAVEVCAYAIMSNHFHLVLYVDTSKATLWKEDEVIDRWLQLFKGPDVARKNKAGEPLTARERDALSASVAIWRARLADLSWYMRCLNETIARMANAEDNCTGRFWEGRFKSQALLDEAALISCMAYVDLNPIRARLCTTLQDSEFTSIQARLGQFKRTKRAHRQQCWLRPMSSRGMRKDKVLPIQPLDYFALVDWTGRAMRQDKRGSIPVTVKPILHRLGVQDKNWVSSTQHFGNRFHRALGRVNQLRLLAERTGQRWLSGLSEARSFYA